MSSPWAARLTSWPDEGLLASEDGGRNWSQLAPRKYAEGISGHQWCVRPSSDGRIISTISPWAGAKEYPNAVLVSDDYGKTFTKCGAGLPDYVPKVNTMWGQGYARALAVDPRYARVLYLGIDGDPEPAKGRAGGGVFRSADGGRTWKALPAQPGSRRIFKGLAVDPTDSRRLFWGACGERGDLYRTDNGGESWERANVPESWVFNVCVSQEGTVYCTGKNLWRSQDHGRTWKKLTNSKDPSEVIVGLELDPGDERRLWYSRVTWGEFARGGIFRSIDGGATWQEITGDIGYRKPVVLRYNPQTAELWAGGVGLFKLAEGKRAAK